MDIEEFKSKIDELDSISFCRRFLFNDYVWLFENKDSFDILSSYDEYKMIISETIDINPKNISIVGSSKYGFSMSPTSGKAFKEFSVDKSDVDTVIVSEKIFYLAWENLRKALYNGYGNRLNSQQINIAKRFVSFKSTDSFETTYMKDTSEIINNLSKNINITCRIKNDFNFRIYMSWDDVETYHAYGIEEIKRTSLCR